MTLLPLTRPDDWHLHLRDGEMLAAVLPDTARRFARAMVMPNLDPPVRTVDDATLEVDDDELASAENLSFTNALDDVAGCNVYIVTVPARNR